MRSAVVLLLAATLACDLTSPEGEAADVRGTWQFTGTQTAPNLDLEGNFTISEQSGQAIAGSATWNETSSGGGGVVMMGGPLSGRAIGDSDVDFDVTLGSGTRRFVARLVADTISGAWVQVSTSTNGTFRAVRETP